MNKLLVKAVKAVKVLRKDWSPWNDAVVVKKGVASIIGFNYLVSVKECGLEDGIYDKSFLSKGLIKVLPLFDYAELFEYELGEGIGVLNADVVSDVVRAFNFVAKDDLRPYLECVNVQNMSVVSTDAHRMLFKVYDKNLFSNDLSDFNSTNGINIRSNIKNALKLMLGTNLNIFRIGHEMLKENSVAFDNEIMTIAFNTKYGSNGRFPNWERVIPLDFPLSIELKVSDLKTMCSDVLPFADRITNQVVFKFTENSLNVSGEDVDYGHKNDKTFDCSVTGMEDEEFIIGFNGRFIEDYLKTLDKSIKVVKLEMLAPIRAVIFNNEYLLMPTMIK